MKVYIALDFLDGYSPTKILGVFDSLEKAEEFIKDYDAVFDKSGIEEFEVL